jgi:membrane protein DedA with SNARE-associated domain
VAYLDTLLQRLGDLPPFYLYLVIAVGAAAENVVPPVPADTFVLLGAFLAGLGRADPLYVFVWTLVGNVASAYGMYYLAGRYGPRFFRTRIGHRVLHPGQLQQISRFYFRWGSAAIFLSRFLPGLRAVVPLFAGVSGVPPLRLLAPLVSASALWYGVLVYLGAIAGRNWEALLAGMEQVSGWLLLLAALLIAGLAGWWLHSRKAGHGTG